MPIVEGDLKLKYSITTGISGNANGQGNPNLSLGRFISLTEIPDSVVHALFDVITGDENAAGVADYRCVFVHNAHPTLTLLGPRVWLVSQVSGGADVAIGLDTTAASLISSSTDQALQIANETTAPVGVTFSAPTDKANGLVLGDLPAGRCRAIWIRRTATNSGPKNSDGVVIRVEGDTGE